MSYVSQWRRYEHRQARESRKLGNRILIISPNVTGVFARLKDMRFMSKFR